MLITRPYLRERAVMYARRWALERNPLFTDFSGEGGNCTNFVSQCVLAGSCTMNYAPNFGWYYISADDRAPAWTGVEFFYDFMTSNDGVGPFMREVRRRDVDVGDVIQLATDDGDYYHSLIVTALDDAVIYVSAQSNDALDRRLSSYDYVSARYLHVEGVRMQLSDYACFDRLISGESLP